jgi:tetratricopeptide repeat protein 30
MAMGSILWEQGAYSALEQMFRLSAEFCSEHDIWKLNVAHTFFMQVRRLAMGVAEPLMHIGAFGLHGRTNMHVCTASTACHALC